MSENRSTKLEKICFASQVHLKLYRKYGNVFRPYLINLDQDMCAVLGKGRNSKDVSLLRKLINFDANRSHGNFYEPCPFSVIFIY